MNLHEHELSYPFADTLPAPATRLEVAPGVHWLRMPLPACTLYMALGKFLRYLVMTAGLLYVWPSHGVTI